MKFLFGFLLQLSKLPLKLHYAFSDLLFFLMFHVIGYRKKVVRENLQNSFPNLESKEIDSIQKKFYKNFCDYLVETVKAFTITSHELRVRVQHINQDVFHDAKREGKNVILLAGHIFNWEWINALATIIPQEKSYPVYRKVQSSFWEEKIKGIRNKYGNHALEAKEVMRHMLRNENDGNSVYMFVADQTPHISEVSYGVNFLKQKTPAFIGYDKLATRLDLTFIYCDMKKVKRGYYQVNYYKIEPEKGKFEDFEIVKKFHQMLENTINKRPDNYLWSHRKWKYAHAIKRMNNQENYTI